MNKLLYSKFIIDGAQQELSPAQILSLPQDGAGKDAECIVDETVDPEIGTMLFHSSQVEAYLEKVLSFKRSFPLPFPSQYTRFRIATSLLDAIWNEGHFNIGDLAVSPVWHCREGRMGEMSAFYRSVEAVADYVDALGLELLSCNCCSGDGISIDLSVSLASGKNGSEDFAPGLFCTENASFNGIRKVPSSFVDDPKSWIIYVPFDTCEYRCGGSLLAQATGNAGGIAPDLSDSDYFQDCYEVVREMVEDGVVLSGMTVSDGGMIAAVKKMTTSGTGASIDVGEIMRATDQSDIIRILFAEIPGVILQISDIDFDYIDAEFLLQDVAFYPLGHPDNTGGKLKIHSAAGTGIQKILASLVQNQGAEGED